MSTHIPHTHARKPALDPLLRAAAGLAMLVMLPALAGAAALPDADGDPAGSAVADCYRLAGEPYAPPAFKGVAIEAMDADAAIAACEEARGQDPRDAMLANLTGRAYQARGDFDNARSFFEQADKAGNAYAHANLAWFLIEGAGGPADPEQGLAMLREAADQGNPLAQYSLGLIFREGRAGQKADPATAIGWLEKAAAQGHALAMYDLAILLRDGAGTAADPRASLDWLTKAAALGDLDSMAALGYAYEQGVGTAVDFLAARNWYRKAADGGQIDAMTNLGRLCEAGEGGEVDYAAAFALYGAAAEAGHPTAMANLANLYEFGLGTDASPRDAAYWLARSIMAGNEDVIEQLAAKPGDYAPRVRSELQSFLKARGIYDGPIDGEMNEATVAALRRLPGEQP
jgi:TPR repeat protein